MFRNSRLQRSTRLLLSVWLPFVVVTALFVTVPGCGGGSGGSVLPLGGPLTIAGGLTHSEFFTIVGLVRTAEDRLQVEFTLADGAVPLELADLDGNPRFTLAFIVVDAASGISEYQSYFTRTVNGQSFLLGASMQAPALASAEQVTFDSGGTFESLGAGTYRYTFGNPMPAGFDETATHTVACSSTRDGGAEVANAYAHFVPSGDPVTALREIVTTEACNGCHHDLAEHGGSRKEITFCQTCHTGQTVDPESGNTLDLATLIHRIHYGAELTQQPYFVAGFQQEAHDYSDFVFSQDVRNCTVCHRDGSQQDHWKTRPSRRACSSCHDDVDFETGENHNNIIQTSDDACTICHRDTAAAEYDLSVPGAHTIPYYSQSNPNLTLTILDVQNMVPGAQPTIRFSISDINGAVAIANLNACRVTFGGPSTDYTQIIANDNRFTIRGAGSTPLLVTNAVGDYTYTPFRDAGMTMPYTIPIGASGTWAVGLEARTNSLPAGPTTIQFGSNNPIVNIDLTNGGLGGGMPVTRRTIVSEEKCNACHGDILFHGNTRTELAYCTLCHNRWATDEGRRGTAADPLGPLDPVTNPPESIDFKTMIHKIHRGTGLVNPYTVWGFGSPAAANDFTGTVFPGDLTACEQCHVGSSHIIPVPASSAATVINIAGTPVGNGRDILPPITASCVSCHDSASTLAHAQANTVPIPPSSPFSWTESCDVCHGVGAPFAAHTEGR